ncbi:MAG: hypothetical protein KC516_04000 [Nanoarchaeota archaeon]|nr:hypothetical protein [Nanoarchaeota archaeon]
MIENLAKIMGNLFVFNIFLLAIIISMNYFKKIKKLKQRRGKQFRIVSRELAIGISSGLIVFILSYTATKFNIPNLELKGNLVTIIQNIFSGIFSIIFQTAIIIALLLWAAYEFTEGLTKNNNSIF